MWNMCDMISEVVQFTRSVLYLQKPSSVPRSHSSVSRPSQFTMRKNMTQAPPPAWAARPPSSSPPGPWSPAGAAQAASAWSTGGTTDAAPEWTPSPPSPRTPLRLGRHIVTLWRMSQLPGVAVIQCAQLFMLYDTGLSPPPRKING